MTTYGYGNEGNQPTHATIFEQAVKLRQENPLLTASQAFEAAKQLLTPTIIQALINQLPGHIQHKPGDQFWPDIYVNSQLSSNIRGRLDENLVYHLRHQDGVSHYDLFQQQHLTQLITDLVRLFVI